MEELVAKKNTYSPVWAFFGLKKDHEDDDSVTSMSSCHIGTRRKYKQSIQPSKSSLREGACFDRKKQEKEDVSNKQRTQSRQWEADNAGQSD